MSRTRPSLCRQARRRYASEGRFAGRPHVRGSARGMTQQSSDGQLTVINAIVTSYNQLTL